MNNERTRRKKPEENGSEWKIESFEWKRVQCVRIAYVCVLMVFLHKLDEVPIVWY